MRKLFLAILSASLLLAVSPAQAANKTEARLLLSRQTASPGETVLAAVQLRMQPRWHTYWRNAGDSGDRTRIEWQLPAGFTAGEIQWPPPEKITLAGLTSYIYHNEVLLLVPLTVPKNAPPGPLDLKAAVSWLECEELCVIGKGDVRAALTVGPVSKPSADAPLIEKWQKRIPEQKTSLAARASWETAPTDNKRPVVIEWNAGADVKEADFFPYGDENYTVKGETEFLGISEGKTRLRKMVEKTDGPWPKEIAGLLVQKGAATEAIEVRLAISDSSPAMASIRSLWAMLGLAFLGGLILNIMPCVL